MLKDEAHKELSHTWLFWVALLAPIVLGLIFAGFVAWGSNLGEACISSACVQTFVGYFKYPITIAGLAIPLVAMTAAIHRSKETSVQIKYAAKQLAEAQLNNRFGNYLKHRESFEKLLEGYCARENEVKSRGLVVSSQKIYTKVFPDSGFNNPDWAGLHKKEFIDGLDARVESIMSQKDRGADFDCALFINDLSYLSHELQIGYSSYMWVVMKGKRLNEDMSFVVSSELDGGYSWAVAVADMLEVYSLVKIYAGIYDGRDVAREFAESKIVRNILDSVGLVEFKEPRDYRRKLAG